MALGKNVEKYRPLAEKYGQKYGIDPNVFLGLIQMESGGRTDVRGPNTKYGKALGLGQIMPFNWKAYGQGRDWRDPDAQLDVMGRLLKNQLNRNNGDIADAIRGYFGRGPSDGYTSGPDYVSRVLQYTSKAGGGKSTATPKPKRGGYDEGIWSTLFGEESNPAYGVGTTQSSTYYKPTKEILNRGGVQPSPNSVRQPMAGSSDGGLNKTFATLFGES